mgnify:FL=1
MAFFKLFPQLADTFFFGFGQGLVGPHSFGEAVKEFLPRRLPEVKISLAAGFGIAIGHFKGHGIGVLTPQFGHAVEDGLLIRKAYQDKIIGPVVSSRHDRFKGSADDAHVVTGCKFMKDGMRLSFPIEVNDDGPFFLAASPKEYLRRLPA